MIKNIMHRTALAAACLLIISCSDEIEKATQSSGIFFVPDFQNSWTPIGQNTPKTATRSSTSLMNTEGLGDIYLHTLYVDSIAPSFQQNSTHPLTRATPVNIHNMYNSFGVSAYAYIGEWDETCTPNYMYNVPVSKSGNLWSSSTAVYWPGKAYKMRFFAYAPRENSAYRISESIPGSPTITCTVPADVEAQEDLLVASSGEIDGNFNAGVNLTFGHALTAVKFVCGNDMRAGTVKSVTLKSVNSAGTYSYATNSWSDVKTEKDFSQTLNVSTVAGGDNNAAITDSAQTFMMIPQTLPAGAKIEVLFEDANGEHTLTGSIGGKTWAMGTTVTYKISTTSINWDYTLEVTGTEVFSWEGATNTYTVASYRTNAANGIQEPLSWTAEFSTDGTNWSSTQRPAWLTAFQINGAGSVKPDTCEATVVRAPSTVTHVHTDILRKIPSKGNPSNPYDLSTQGGTQPMNTANCYVVGAPGWYRFPLVYGNAVKNGADNPSAYQYTGEYTGDKYGNMLKTFVNHLGAPIRSPYINKNDNCTAASAELLWQDAPGLVSQISYEGSGEQAYVKFQVARASICQGNAVIVVKDAAGTVLWSWHIWVTNEDISRTKTVMTRTGYTYRLMPVNVGWCDNDSTFFAGRACKVRITAGGLSRTFDLEQKEKVVARVNAPYYQWGRKDPFSPSFGFETHRNKPLYDKSGAVSEANPKIADFFMEATHIYPFGFKTKDPEEQKDTFAMVNISLTIQKPGIGNLGRNYMAGRFFNLWNTFGERNPQQDHEVTKTIYDPCPAGFHLPPSGVFFAFSKSGKITAGAGGKPLLDFSDFNIKSKSEYGFVFYGNAYGTGDEIYIPALGSIFGGFVNIDNRFGLGENVRLWSCDGSLNANSGKMMDFCFIPTIYYYCSAVRRNYWGSPVRGVRE